MVQLSVHSHLCLFITKGKKGKKKRKEKMEKEPSDVVLPAIILETYIT
jgi:hypothetical protein